MQLPTEQGIRRRQAAQLSLTEVIAIVFASLFPDQFVKWSHHVSGDREIR